MKKPPVYLDYASTTPVDPRVADKMMGALTMDGNFGNPASRSHYYGWQAESAVENARGQVATLLNADSRELVWTSGATESNNLAIKGLANYYKKASQKNVNSDKYQGRHIVTSKIEHKSVLDCCRFLECEGFEVTYLDPGEKGLIEPNQVAQAIRSDTLLVSLMHVNNELGTINDIAKISEITRSKHVIFHVDAAQSAGKLGLDLQSNQVDLLSISAHKFYGPKGVGALYVRRTSQVHLEPQIQGGGHERGHRSGTLATHQIIGLGEACELAMKKMDGEHRRLLVLRQQLIDGFKELDAVSLNGCLNQHYPGIVNVSFAYVDGESLLMGLNGIAVSSGSACTSASVEPSYVLRAIGVARELAHSSIRFSLGRFTTEADVAYVVDQVRVVVSKLRERSTSWRQDQVNKKAH